MFLLDNGRVSVYEWNGNFVTTLTAGTIFGEMALLMGDFTRHATVR
jgi:CRP-like cAMP-binding protein